MVDLPTTYASGTVTLGAGSTTVTGSGTAFVAAGLEPGDIFWAAGLSVRIAAVASPTSLTLAYPWPGAALAAANYEVRYTPDATRALAATRELLSALANGNLSSLAGLATAANKLAYYTGAGTAALADLTTQARGLLGGTALSRSGSDYTLNGKLLGSVLAASAVDQTAGKLLTTGYGGIGGAITLTAADNLDNLIFGGLYYNPTAGNTAGNNYPVGSAGALLVIYRSSNNAMQLFVPYADSPAFFYRSKGPSGWSVWRRLDGDRGSNGNGDYVRYADGTLICTRTMVASASAAVTWTFPAAFSAAPVITGTAVATVLASVCLDSAPTTTSAALSVRDKTDARRADSMVLTALGRWF
ncbi:pyocin knob domain-containing protein [Gemmobacter fulvus]|uniref:pyocin knob domain-containing protein n=1 Tax=Gemmobacter fulvus TaxID=2840474 RepID=UPI00279687DB|nr:pyocin knob domain-containing protein [Gemmobacter fulvus]MDQ1847661.1 pyocin knob domain-containing protein [Gemmobacter fulvus]